MSSYPLPLPLIVGLVGSVACAGTAGSATPVEPEHHPHELHLPPVGPTVDVRLEGKSATVTLGTLPHTGTQATIADLVKAAWPSADPATTHFDFFGSDGFHPAARTPCTRLLGIEEIARGHIDVVTHDLSFEEPPALAGCYHVHAVVTVDLLR